jgi:hypothetical protein
MLSSPVDKFVSELETSEIPEGIMRHAVKYTCYVLWAQNIYTKLTHFKKLGSLVTAPVKCFMSLPLTQKVHKVA